MISTSLHAKEAKQLQQRSFIGGHPRIPAQMSIPCCSNCGADQTFFFQIEIPETPIWKNLSLAVFSCTKCASEETLIPEMPSAQLYNAEISIEFLENYQKNFSFSVFPTSNGVLRNDYKPLISFKELVSDPGENLGSFGKLFGTPIWILEDETPGLYNEKTSFEFLMQIKAEFRFDLIEGAEAQVEIGLSGRPELSPLNHYELFIGNEVYLFGTLEDMPQIYALTQCQ